jgi:sialate O-acetylesterase
MKYLPSFIVLLFYSIASYGTIRLPSVIGSNMVLQQNANARLWGWCAPGEKIFVTTSWNNKTDSVTGSSGAKWMVSVQTPAAGGPYTITLKGQNTIVLNDVLIGEVWVCSGQSNMEWSYMNKLPQIKEELPSCYNKNIRFFHIPKTTANYPQDDCQAQWTVCDSNTLKTFSAVGYFFGKKLNKDLNIPIGLINSSWGGTPAEAWTPDTIVNSDAALKEAAGKLTTSKNWPIEAGVAYNAMIAPITSYAIAGAIWYQGESNTNTYATYNQLFTDMISSWRKAWNKELPFYYVQIAPFKYGVRNVGALLREQQTKTMALPHTGMVVITDLVNDTANIHPLNKRDVGDRLAAWALHDTYNKDVMVYQSPVYKSMEVKKGKVYVQFDHAPNGLVIKGKNLTELYVAGIDKQFYPAEARLEKGQLVLWSKQVKEPVAVRFGFANTAVGNLFSKEGLPVNPFRTDEWEVDTSKL